MRLNKTEITAIKPGKRRKEYIVRVRYKDVDGKMSEVQLARSDIARIVKVALSKN